MTRDSFRWSLNRGGCQSKVPHRDLAQMLATVGLRFERDSGIVAVCGDKELLASVDLLSPFCSDPAVVGEGILVHCLGDLFASMATPVAALSIVIVGQDDSSDAACQAALGAAVERSRHIACPIIGGHTVKGETSRIGFCVIGSAPGNRLKSETTRQVTDYRVLLTKPLGLSYMLGLAEIQESLPPTADTLLPLLLADDALAVTILRRHDVVDATDVSGFGLGLEARKLAKRCGHSITLFGHLIPHVFGDVPNIPTTTCLWRSNYADVQSADDISYECNEQSIKALLAVPAVAGGLVVIVPTSHASRCIAELRAAGYVSAEIGASAPGPPRVTIVGTAAHAALSLLKPGIGRE